MFCEGGKNPQFPLIPRKDDKNCSKSEIMGNFFLIDTQKKIVFALIAIIRN